MPTLTTKYADAGKHFRLHIFFDSKARDLLERCTITGSELAGHRVSYSTIVRRALTLLAEHHRTLKTSGAKATERSEFGTVMLR